MIIHGEEYMRDPANLSNWIPVPITPKYIPEYYLPIRDEYGELMAYDVLIAPIRIDHPDGTVTYEERK